MIVVMNPLCTTEDINHVVALLGDMGARSWVVEGAVQNVVEVLGANGHVNRRRLEDAPMVDSVFDRADPVLATRQEDHKTHEVAIGSEFRIGGRRLGIIAGPCSVESRNQLLDIAAGVREGGASALRGGAFKPRTSPYSFQGHGESALEFLALAREQTGLAIVTEVMRCEHVDLVAKYADVLQVGSRNMHNTHLLAAVGQQSKPVLLKRGWSATLEEFLLAAEYVMAHGNPNVMCCERGIRTHETYVRNTLALAIVPEIKHVSRLPVIVDPSHGTGRRHLVEPMSKAAVACGADGLLIEVHHDPSKAWTDGSQTLDMKQFGELMKNLQPIAHACNREL
jgi:3-deoxy-7-phosphoheptulonate synthase